MAGVEVVKQVVLQKTEKLENQGSDPIRAFFKTPASFSLIFVFSYRKLSCQQDLNSDRWSRKQEH